MMSFMNDLPYMLGQRYTGVQFKECTTDDGKQTGWHIMLRNGWLVSVQQIPDVTGLSVMAWPDYPGHLHYNFRDDVTLEEIYEVSCQPHQVMSIIKLISELPGEIPSDWPDPLDAV